MTDVVAAGNPPVVGDGDGGDDQENGPKPNPDLATERGDGGAEKEDSPKLDSDRAADGDGGSGSGSGGGDGGGGGGQGSSAAPAAENDREDSEFRRVAPAQILPSPFGDDVNPVATPAEDAALKQSIAEKGVLVPLVCEETAKGQLRVLAGNRRLRFAKELRKASVPVMVVRFEAREAARQLAIRDNVERRQLSMVGKARLGVELWRSYEKTEKRDKHADKPLQRAATDAGIGVTTLTNYKFVIDSGFVDLIAKLDAGTIAIDAAHKEARSRVNGQRQKEVRRSRMVRVEETVVDLKGITDALGRIPGLSKRLVAHLPGVVGKGKKSDVERLRNKLATARKVLEEIQTDATVGKLAEAIAQVEAGLK